MTELSFSRNVFVFNLLQGCMSIRNEIDVFLTITEYDPVEVRGIEEPVKTYILEGCQTDFSKNVKEHSLSDKILKLYEPRQPEISSSTNSH